MFSWQNSVILCLTTFCTPRPNLPVTPGISWLPTFAFQPPMMKRTVFVCLFLVLVLEGLVGLNRTVQLQLFWHYWLGHRLGLLWYWTVCLGNKQRSLCHFWDCTQVLHFGLLLTMGFLPTVVDIMVIWIKFTHFQSILVHWFLKCHCSLLPSAVWPLPIYLDSWT